MVTDQELAFTPAWRLRELILEAYADYEEKAAVAT